MATEDTTLGELSKLIIADELTFKMAKDCLQAQEIGKMFPQERALVGGEKLFRTLPECYLQFIRNNYTRASWTELYKTFDAFPLLYSYDYVQDTKKLFQCVCQDPHETYSYI